MSLSICISCYMGEGEWWGCTRLYHSTEPSLPKCKERTEAAHFAQATDSISWDRAILSAQLKYPEIIWIAIDSRCKWNSNVGLAQGSEMARAEALLHPPCCSSEVLLKSEIYGFVFYKNFLLPPSHRGVQFFYRGSPWTLNLFQIVVGIIYVMLTWRG